MVAEIRGHHFVWKSGGDIRAQMKKPKHILIYDFRQYGIDEVRVDKYRGEKCITIASEFIHLFL